MAISTDAVGKTLRAGRRTPSAARRSASTRSPSARRTRCTSTSRGARRKGYRDLVAPPMFCVVYCGAAAGAGDVRPRGRDRLRPPGPRRPGVPLGPARGRRRRDRDDHDGQGHLRARRDGLLRRSSRSPPTRTATRCASAPGRTSSAERERDAARRRDPDLTVTPDKYLTVRYAGASGDFNPIHIDEDFAHQVGLPGQDPPRPVDDGAGRPGADRGRGRPARAEAPQRAVPRHGRPRGRDHGDRERRDGRGRHRDRARGRRAGRHARSSATPRPSCRSSSARGAGTASYNRERCSRRAKS